MIYLKCWINAIFIRYKYGFIVSTSRYKQHSILKLNMAYLTKKNLALISIVTKGELLALGLKNNWGNRRITQLEQFF